MTDLIKELLAKAGDGAYISNNNGPRAHRLVMRQAKEFCIALHEKFCMQLPGFAQKWPDPEAFAKCFWPHFCAEARATLAQLLASTMNERLKEQIHDGLMKDHSLAHTRDNIPQVRMDV